MAMQMETASIGKIIEIRAAKTRKRTSTGIDTLVEVPSEIDLRLRVRDWCCPDCRLLVSLHLPQLFRSLTYQAQRRNFMQAVRWNRTKIVQTLVESAAPGNAAIESTTGNHFLDFLEAGIECAISRGLEGMAIYLVSQWQGLNENGCESATPSAFAFQFASAFQVACIRNLPKLLERMIERGGEEIVEFHLNEGPALTYAFAFGHTEVAALLLRSGADPSIPTATYSVPSIRKWVEFGSPNNVRVSWQPEAVDDNALAKRTPFIGPLATYEIPTPRLPIDDLCRMLADLSCAGERTPDPSGAKSIHAESAKSATTVTEQVAKAKKKDSDEAGLNVDNHKDDIRPGELPDAAVSGESMGGGGISSMELGNNDEGKTRQAMDELCDAVNGNLTATSKTSGEDGGQVEEDTEPAEANTIDHPELNNEVKAAE